MFIVKHFGDLNQEVFEEFLINDPCEGITDKSFYSTQN